MGLNYRRPFTIAVHASLVGIPGPSLPQEKMNLGLAVLIWGAYLLSSHSIFCHVLSSPRSHHPHYFYANLDELQGLYFQKVGRYVRTYSQFQTPVAPLVFLTVRSFTYLIVSCYKPYTWWVVFVAG